MSARMTELSAGSHWVISESGERWYQAVCRFAKHGRIERVGIYSTAAIIAKSNFFSSATIVIWELPSDARHCIDFLDVVASVRQASPATIQVASLPVGASTTWKIAAQQAGAQILLDDLACLPRLVDSLSFDQARTTATATIQL